MPLVINSLRGGHTHTLKHAQTHTRTHTCTRTHTDVSTESILRNQARGWCVPGLKIYP